MKRGMKAAALAMAAVLLSSSGLLLLSASPSVAASPAPSGTLYLSPVSSVQKGPCSQPDPNSYNGGPFAGSSLVAKDPSPTSQTFQIYGYYYPIPDDLPYCMQAAYNGPSAHMVSVSFTFNVAGFTDPLMVGFALYNIGTDTKPFGPVTEIAAMTSSPLPASPSSTCSSPVQVTLHETISKSLAKGDELALDVLLGSYPTDTSTLSPITYCWGQWSSSSPADSVTITAT